ncbi:stalk domain-containing protein [Moorella naiadis]
MPKKFLAILLALLLFLSLSAPGAMAASPRPVVVQGAMNLEMQNLVAALEDPVEVTYGGWTFWQGSINGLPVVVSRTEVGMTNAAAATLLAIEKFHPRAIINQGTSGGHDPSLHRFDIVLGQKAINFGKFKSNHRDYGQGIAPESWVPEDVKLRLDGKEVSFHGFPGDPELIKIAQSVAGTYQHGRIVAGVIGTADEWNRELDRIKWVHEKFGTSVEEMETASAAQVARAYNIPFLGIRILSNSEPQNEGWDPKAGAYCQEYVLQVIKALAAADTFGAVSPALFVNGSQVALKHTPLSISGFIYLPVREVFENLGGVVAWDNDRGAALVKIDGRDLTIKGDGEGLLKDDTLYIPAQSLSQMLNYHVVLNDGQAVRLYQ